MSELVKQWDKDGVAFEIRHLKASYADHYCGYCIFERRPVREQGSEGLLTYVPVHGGITLAGTDDDGRMRYGFDCAHADDDHDPKVRDMDWLTAECERMADGIKAAVPFEPPYLLAATSDERAKIIDAYHATLKQSGIDFDLSDNFGAMLRVLAGTL